MANIPEDLPFRIIDRELELEHRCDLHVVNDLVSMYRVLIEAYESAKDPKFIDFQNRLHKILMREDVQDMLRKQSRIDKRRKDDQETEMKRTQFRSRKTASMEADQVKLSRKLSRIMENRQNIDKGTVGKAVNDFASQNTNLSERLEKRRRQSSLCTRPYILFTN
jgi:hypothetical protein